MKIVKIVIVLAILALLGSLLWQFISINIKRMEVKGNVEEALFGEIKSDEYIVMEKIQELLAEKNITIPYEDIHIEKDGNKEIKVDFTYTDSITIPFILKSFYFDEEIQTIVSPR